MEQLLLCHLFYHQLDSHKAEALQLEIRSERQKSWQNGNDVLWAAGTHWYWNEAAGRRGPVSNGRAALLNSGRLSGMWSNASAPRPYRSANPGFLAFNWLWSLLDSSPLSVPLLRPDEEMCPRFVSNSVCTLENLGPTIMDMWRACLIYQHFNFVTGLITFWVHLSIAVHYWDLLPMDDICSLILVNF